MSCLSASTFTVPLGLALLIDANLRVTNAYRQVHLLYLRVEDNQVINSVTNAYRQVHLLYLRTCLPSAKIWESQMPIGKYIYCTECNRVIENPKKAKVTNAYRQVHLLYNSGDLVEA